MEFLIAGICVAAYALFAQFVPPIDVQRVRKH